MARVDDDFDPQQLDRDALMEQLGAQVDDRPQSAFDQSYRDGQAAGQDMSWMKAPGGTTGVGVSADVDAPTSGTMPVEGPPPRSAQDAFGLMASGINAAMSPTRPQAPALTPKPMPTNPAGSFQAKHDFSAFDTAREQNPAKSAKDAFAMLANQAPPPPFHDKAALGQWFAQYIQPGMDQLGHKVSSVDGDKFSYGNHEGNFSVDYGQNAGAAAGSMQQRLQWGAEPSDAATTQRYAPGGAGAGTGSPTLPTAAAPPVSGQQGVSQDAIDAIMREVQALQSGGQSPMDAEALMALLQQGGVA